MADVTAVLVRTIFEEASAGHFELFLKSIAAELVPESLKDKDGNTLLHLSAWAGKLPIVKETLRLYPGLTNTQNSIGTTPLMMATAQGNIELMQTLIKCGADVRLKDVRGADSLLVAAEKDQAMAVLVLLWSGADPNTTDSSNCGLMHWAAYHNSVQVTNLLVSLGTDIQRVDAKGMSPLHRAAISNAVGTTKCLLASGADRLGKDSSGRTALDVAIQNTAYGVQNLLSAGQRWRVSSMHLYLYMLLLAVYYLVYILWSTAQMLIPSLFFINAYLIALLCFLSVSRSVAFKFQCSDLEALKTSYEAGELSALTNQTEFCFKCMRTKPARTHHCSICNQCVPAFDQHSELFSVCVNEENRGRFLLGLGSFTCALGMLIYLDYTAEGFGLLVELIVGEGKGSREWFSFVMTVGNIAVFWGVLSEWFLEVRAVGRGLTVYETLHRQECRYLFKPFKTAQRQVCIKYANPYDFGKVINWVKFLQHGF